jgi:hypothetical protein
MAKGLLALIFLTLLPSVLYAQKGAPIDVANIELLISAHKKTHDRLEERNEGEVKHNAVTKLVQEVSEKYEKVHKDLMNKYNLASQWVGLGINALSLVGDLNNLRRVLPPFLQHVNKIKRPAVLLRYVRAVKSIRGDIEFLVKVSSSIPALRLNAEELSDIVTELRSSISTITYTIRNYTYAIQGQIALVDLMGQPSFPDRAKIAADVIKEFNKQND